MSNPLFPLLAKQFIIKKLYRVRTLILLNFKNLDVLTVNTFFRNRKENRIDICDALLDLKISINDNRKTGNF